MLAAGKNKAENAALPSVHEYGEKASRGGTPELLVLLDRSPEDPVLLSLISQLIENGIYFVMADNRDSGNRLPDDFRKYRALLMDRSTFSNLPPKGGTAKKLEKYAAEEGFLFKMHERACPDVESGHYDTWNSWLVYNMVSHASLTRFHPEFEKRQLERSDDEIMNELRESLVKNLQTKHWHEFTMHFWKSAALLAEIGGQEDISVMLQNSIREMAEVYNSGFHSDHLAGLFGCAWLYIRTGENAPLEKARKLLDRVIDQRPRSMGVLTNAGFLDDPLGLEHGGKDDWDWICRRDLIWTETLHMCGGAFAAVTRATGDRRYLEESLKLIRHCRRYHLDGDNLLFHCTYKGAPAAGKWARGVGHALYGMMYTLEEMDESDPGREEIIDFLRQVGIGLKYHQDGETGLWRNLIDHPDARLETSGTAAFTYVYGRAVMEGWLPAEEFAGMVRLGRRGLKRCYWKNGFAAHCRGTSTGRDNVYYLARPQGWARLPHGLMAMFISENI